MKHVTHICGTRPNWIKCEPVYQALAKLGVEQTVIDTRQHYDSNLSDFFTQNINVFKAPLAKPSLGEMIHYLTIGIPTETFGVVVYGDTNSSLAGAIAATQRKIPLFHVEAGLRCGDLQMIEEVNRIMIDSVSTINFCPSDRERKNVPEKSACTVGDVMYDIWLQKKHSIQNKGYVLLTIHRAQLVDSPSQLAQVLRKIKSDLYYPIIFPIHPRTAKMCIENNIELNGFETIEPVSHDRLLQLIDEAAYVITDSGGVSKEAIWAKKPTAILRERSEWGIPCVGKMFDHFEFIKNGFVHPLESGDGTASQKIAETLAGLYPSFTISIA